MPNVEVNLDTKAPVSQDMALLLDPISKSINVNHNISQR